MTEVTQPLSLLAMLTIGFLGSSHCIGMCGGIATGLGMASQGKNNPLLILGYNVGRLTSYAVAGVLVALIGYWGKSHLMVGPWLRILAGCILVLMGFYIAGWWQSLRWLENLGGHVWRRIQPVGNRFMPVTSVGHALCLGLVWGWLPCGLVYSALAYAATAASPVDGGLMMLAFGLGTMPAMVLGGIFAASLKAFFQRRWVRLLMAVIIMGFGVWTLYGAAGHLLPSTSGDGAMHHHHSH
jgi:uncharacterized protein